MLALRHGPAGYEVRINATTLDLSPWLDREEGPEAAGPEVPVRLSLQAARLMVDDNALTDVDAELVREPDGWRSAGLTGRLPHGGAVELALAPEGDQRKLRLTSTDFGELLQMLLHTGRIEGGELELEATILQQEPGLRAEGTLVAHKFDVLDAPTLARLLTVASLTGIGHLLGGEGIAFERLEIPFVVRDETLSVERGRLYGSQLGLTFQGSFDLAADIVDLEGTIVPLYGVNWAIGQIPIIGQLLKGSEGDGAFAATYTMRGPLDDATISVNPLAALAPGFVRELFSGLREGSLEAPEMLPTHDD
jgi:uncharacterized protein YhdP